MTERAYDTRPITRPPTLGDAEPTPALALQRLRNSAAARVGQSHDIRGALPDPHAIARAGIRGRGGPLPFTDRIQASFGRHDIGAIHAHTDRSAADAAAALGAAAYATGDAVAFDGAPDLHTAAHEAAHVIQQRGGVQLLGGLGTPGDRYETHADAVADKVVAGQSAEALLDEMSGATGSPNRKAGAVQAAGGAAVQRKSVRETHEERGDDTPDQSPPLLYPGFIEHDGQAPTIRHDHGFLDDGQGNIDESRRRDPTWRDHLARAKWIAKLEIAEALRPDLVDATSAYRHFLFGGGAQRTLDYQRFIDGDSSGARVFESALEDARFAAVEHHDRLIGGTPRAGTWTFQLRTADFGVGNDGRYPYPATENWQKAIGAHKLWLELDVRAVVEQLSSSAAGAADQACLPDALAGAGPSAPPAGGATYIRRFEVAMTLHMDDRYNFNPGAADIKTGIPDDDNGRFEVTGLGQEYENVARLERSFEFETDLGAAARTPDAVAGMDVDRGGRTRQPDGSRGRATER